MAYFTKGPIKLPYTTFEDYAVAEVFKLQRLGSQWESSMRQNSSTNSFIAATFWTVGLDVWGNVMFKSYPYFGKDGEFTRINGDTPGIAEIRLYGACCNPALQCGWPILLGVA